MKKEYYYEYKEMMAAADVEGEKNKKTLIPFREQIKKIAEHNKSVKKVLNKQKKEVFLKMGEEALWLAEQLYLNVYINEYESEMAGEIIFCAENILFDNMDDLKICDLFIDIFSNADEMLISTNKTNEKNSDTSTHELVKLTLFYRFYE